MLRAAVKAAILFGFGRAPGGARLYRSLTRDRLGTQATHVDKLQRVWPGYVDVWSAPGGMTLEGSDIWVHESGWTPFALFANYLLTGTGGIVTNSEARILDRYLARAVNGALATVIPDGRIPPDRRRKVEALRWAASADEAIREVGGKSVSLNGVTSIPLPSNSVDLCHSGGALEHYSPDHLREFLSECYRILRPGGIASHVFDHRDHLYHADKRYPFLAHLALPDLLYSVLFGHPLTYHNRLLPSEVSDLFDKAGFERLTVRQMGLPDRRYRGEEEAMDGLCGIERRRLARRFRHALDADLRTAAAHYMYRKPRRA